jgi:glutamate dehydrogenase (NAD(P)+)
MIQGFQQILEIMHQHNIDDLRTAAFVCGLHKVVTAYEQLGIWP